MKVSSDVILARIPLLVLSTGVIWLLLSWRSIGDAGMSHYLVRPGNLSPTISSLSPWFSEPSTALWTQFGYFVVDQAAIVKTSNSLLMKRTSSFTCGLHISAMTSADHAHDFEGFCRDKEGRARKGQRLELVMQLGSERAGQECARVCGVSSVPCGSCA
jgi:hypothetical protein